METLVTWALYIAFKCRRLHRRWVWRSISLRTVCVRHCYPVSYRCGGLDGDDRAILPGCRRTEPFPKQLHFAGKAVLIHCAGRTSASMPPLPMGAWMFFVWLLAIF